MLFNDLSVIIPIMIRKALLLKIFDAAYMQRWNDKVRPVDLIEMDNSTNGYIKR